MEAPRSSRRITADRQSIRNWSIKIENQVLREHERARRDRFRTPSYAAIKERTRERERKEREKEERERERGREKGGWEGTLDLDGKIWSRQTTKTEREVGAAGACRVNHSRYRRGTRASHRRRKNERPPAAPRGIFVGRTRMPSRKFYLRGNLTRDEVAKKNRRLRKSRTIVINDT